jgi:hypothetical protein
MEEKKTSENQQQIYLNEEEIDFRDTIVSILAKNGYYPKVNEHCIIFDYQGDRIFIFIDNPYDLHIDYPFFSYDREEEFYIMGYINELNWSFGFSRFLITNDNWVIARIKYPLNRISNVDLVFWDVLNSVLSSAAYFKNNFRQNNNQLVEQ